ncbi:MAG: acyl--CoA ligase [Leucobacter sp.]|nr:acyl--CoA ligase [Leucobacter sp.]
MNSRVQGLHPQSKIDNYVAKGWWTDETIDDLFWRQVEARSDAIAITDPLNRVSLDGEEPRRLSWRDLGAEVTYLAARMLELGLKRGDRIGMQMPNSIEQVQIYLAAWSIGVVVSPLALQYREHETVAMVNQAELDAYIVAHHFADRQLAQEVADFREQLPTVRHLLTIGLAEAAPIDGVQRIVPQPATDADARALAEYRAHNPNHPNDLVTICWTSGTEGKPKGVLRAHYDWINFNWAVMDGLNGASSIVDGEAVALGDIDHNDVLLNPFPLINMAGINGMLLPWLRTACLLVQHHPFDAPTFFAQVAKERVTWTILPPALLWMLLNNEQLLSQVDLSSLNRLGSGSAPLQPAMVRGWQEKMGLFVINFFGSNEGVALLSNALDFPNADDRANFFPRYGAPGVEWSSRVSKWVRVKLVDPETQEVITEPGRPGELYIDGPQLFGGYLNGQDLANPFDDEGYLKTGDVFEIAGENNEFLRYVDRAKDLVIRGGMNISPVEIEQLISEHPAVLEVSVVGDPDEVLGERVAAVVVLRPEAELTLDELVNFLRERRIASFKLPERLRIIDALPRNPVGKVLKRDLRLTTAAK